VTGALRQFTARQKTSGLDLPVTSGLYAHYSAKSLSGTHSDGDPVTSVPDISTNSFDLSGTGTFKTGVLNGNPVLRGNGSTNSLRADGMEPGLQQPYTAFAVWRSYDTTGSDRTAFGADDFSSGTNGFLFRLYPEDSHIDYWFGGSDSSLMSIPTAAYSEFVYTSVRASTSFAEDTNKHIRENGVRIAPTGTSEGSGSRGLRRLTLFSRSGGSNPGTVDVAEVLLYDRRLTQQEVEDVESYLASQWGITP